MNSKKEARVLVKEKLSYLKNRESLDEDLVYNLSQILKLKKK